MTETTRKNLKKEKFNYENHELYSLLSLYKDDGPTSFEDAIKQTRFGKFNIMLMVFAICGIFSPMFETTTMSYIFASAQCDLDLSLQDKGYLNSITYAGMISSSFIWGFLLDTLGRRKLMVYGYFLDAVLIFISANSQNFTMLLVCKFLQGAVINGPFAAMTAYLSEFHSSKYRSRIQLANGTLTSLAQIVLPLLAWTILPLDINWSSISGAVEFHSWNLFVMLTGVFPFISGIIFYFLPESPKYLMTSGENEEAMKVLQMVYSWNTGHPPDMYPVKKLMEEIVHNEKDLEADELEPKTKMDALNDGLRNLAPLFKSPYLAIFLLITFIQISFLTSLNMLRLWTPQLFQAIEDYKLLNNHSTSDLCTMIEVLKPKSNNMTACTTNVGQSSVYINAMLVACLSIVCYILTGSLITILGKKKLLIILGVIGSVSCVFLYFAHGAMYTTICTALVVSCGNVCGNIILSVVVDCFPTNLRAFTVSLVMAAARIGITCGNMLFPVLLQQDCIYPFAFIGGVMTVAGLLSCLLPNTENKPLQ